MARPPLLNQGGEYIANLDSCAFSRRGNQQSQLTLLVPRNFEDMPLSTLQPDLMNHVSAPVVVARYQSAYKFSSPRPTERIRPSAWRMKANNAASGPYEPVTIHTLYFSSVCNGLWLAMVSAPYRGCQMASAIRSAVSASRTTPDFGRTGLLNKESNGRSSSDITGGCCLGACANSSRRACSFNPI